jgi:peptidyl-prolyl cis-trans isomerase C
MPTFSKRLLLASACVTLILSGCNTPPISSSEPGKDSATVTTTAPITAAGDSKIVANVNGAAITLDEFNEYAAHRIQPGSNPTAAEANAIINEMVSLELVVQEALKKGLDKKPDVLKTIESQRRVLLANAALKDYIESHPITDEQLKKEYDQRVAGAAGSKELKARHILVKTEAEAKAIIAQIGKGADFAKLAKVKSSDSSAKAGGDLGWFNPNQMVKPFSDAALALKKGEYTKTPVQSQFGWHVIKLEDSRNPQVPAFDQMKERVRNFMQQKMSQDFIDGLKTAGKVEIKEQNLPVAAEPAAPPAPAPAPAPAAPPAASAPAGK